MKAILSLGNLPSLVALPAGTVSAAESFRPTKRLSEDAKASSQSELRQTFDAFLGQVYFGQMLKAMRRTIGKPAYIYGGIAEDIFTQQLDQVLAEALAKQLVPQFSGPMFELFTLGRR